jgi:hypothetical protein
MKVMGFARAQPILHTAFPGRCAARSDALLIRGPSCGLLCRGSRLCGAALKKRCTASGTREKFSTPFADLPLLSIPLCKNISLSPSGKSSLQIRAIHPTEGRIMIVTKRGEGCGGRGSVLRATGLQGESKDL